MKDSRFSTNRLYPHRLAISPKRLSRPIRTSASYCRTLSHDIYLSHM